MDLVYAADVNKLTCPASGVIAVVFDGDDTLWSTEQLYDDARSMARRVVADSGLDGARWEEAERRIDLEQVATLGFSTERFPRSCVEAYHEICRRDGIVPDPAIGARVHLAARSVFERDPLLVPGARATLALLRARGVRLALLSKGDPDLQQRRIKHSRLAGLFDVIQVVPDKSPDTIREIVASVGGDVRSAWMVGNSFRSDVLPAIKVGLRAVWIKAHVWEYERAADGLAENADPRVIAASNLTDVPDLVAG
jgi:putative hydrolase of the HAD superfamily